MECNVVFLGDYGVGKTSLIKRFVDGTFESYPVLTIGHDFYNRSIVVDDENVEFKLFDRPASEPSSYIRQHRVKKGNCYLINYSIDIRSSIESIEKIYHEIVDIIGKNVPIMICGNKCDLEEQRVISKHEGKNLAKRLGVGFVETSALSNTNVDETFIALARMFRKLLPNKE
ncbi:ras-related protein Rab-37-like isoform X3 [Histomonas meleagridis]|uniref:ras-related protein Rab-37-like isoform X3 n=1 Tax=Histomonas meleagridis TaxID=135588 RepID=UPI00355A9FDD|nr:ras-related protein Rab-37-like isoform X3 [Histomonas meleagridis]KAH0797340.1 ras-related protein Rab-37-like isoform X3 [Histomonas meleagridis]